VNGVGKAYAERSAEAMGNTLRQHDDLLHVRGWTKEQIEGTNKSLRRQKKVYAVNKDDFLRYFGGRSKELLIVFSNLDTDYDGKVDIFEILTVLSLWGGTTWDEKLILLFEVFDLMGKGFLKTDEMMMMGSVLVSTLKKFINVDSELSKPMAIRELSRKAVATGDGSLSQDQFRTWASGSEVMLQLKGCLEDHAPRSHPTTQEGRMRMHMGKLDRLANKLFESVERLQDRLPEFTNACMDFVASLGRRKRWDFTMQNLRQLILSLQNAYEQMHLWLSELEATVSEDENSGGTMSMINPERRFQQEQSLIDLDGLAKQSSRDFREATELVRRLLELTEPPEVAGGEFAEEEDRGIVMRNQEHKTAMQEVFAEMCADIQTGGMFGAARNVLGETEGEPEGETTASPLSKLVDTPGKRDGARASGGAILVAVANFEPPESHETQMLKLLIGDQVTVLGQDGRGWWYGQKQNGKEGWFPPSYVQVKGAHFSAASEATAAS